MRPMRNDGGYGMPLALDASSYNRLYHRDWTKAFIRMVLQLYPGSVIYFGDKLIYEDPEFQGKVIKYFDHDNHLYVILPGGERGKKEGQ